jgi:uncharacterized delta-60 repeat protein
LLVVQTAWAAVEVSGPPGLALARLLPTNSLSPLMEQMPLKNRLDMSVVFTNGTGQPLVFTAGSGSFRDAAGKLLLAAAITPAEFLARRRLAVGSTFENGPVQIRFADYTNATLTGLSRYLDGRILAGGWAVRTSDGQKQFMLVRLQADGAFDDTFGGSGMKAGSDGEANALALQSDGKILLAGTWGPDFRVQRFTSNGTEDAGFGAGGVQTTSLGANAEAHAVGVDSLGRVVVAGRVQNGNAWQLALARYRSSGALDNSFGDNGIVVTDLPGSASEGIAALAIDGTDRIVVAGWGLVTNHLRMAVARYLAGNGGLDKTFSGDGVVLAAFTGADDVEARSVAIDGAGRVVVGGAAYQAGIQRMAVARFTAAGALDVTFSGDGQVITDFFTTDHETISALTISGDNILAAGRAVGEETEYFAVARYDSAGELDLAFAGDGKLRVGIADAEFASASGIVTLPSGDIVVAGTCMVNGGFQWALARYNPDGTPDTTATIPQSAEVTLELNDFPFFLDVETEGFDGFGARQTPVQLDLQMTFNGIAQPFVIRGLELELFEQNARAYRFPLHNPETRGAEWVATGGHERGTPHGNTVSQRFHWDLVAKLSSSALRTGCHPDDFLQAWAGHPNFVPGKTYTSAEMPNCHLAWGEPVYAAAAGTVIRAANDKWDNFPSGDKTFGTGGGNSVILDHGNGEVSFYAHMQKGSVLVSSGQVVAAGQKLGLVGNSGSSSGPHLHFGLVDVPGKTSVSEAQSVPVYFIDAKFPTYSGGAQLRQLRAAPRENERVVVDPSPVPFSSAGTAYGPGLVNEVGSHDSIENPQRLALPVSVVGTVAPGHGDELADGGDAIEDVFRFTVTQNTVVLAQLQFDAGADLDMILYDQNLRAVQPSAAKTLSNPERLCLPVSAGTYYLLVSQYDQATLPAPVNYTLHVGAYANGRDIYVDKNSVCLVPFGNPACNADWGGPFPIVNEGVDAICPASRMFIRTGTYTESVLFRGPVIVRSYEGTVVINP